MAVLSVHLLGKFVAYTAPPIAPAGLEPRKVQELLCYLLIHRNHPQHRESLAGTLWGETTAAQSRANLRKTLWQLHAALEPCAAAGPVQLIEIQGDWLQIHPKADLWLDIELLERAYLACNGQNGEELSEAVAATLEAAVQLYHSDLLDGWYQDWCIFERERLQNMYLALLDKLMGYCEVHDRYEQGLAYGSVALRYDRTREQVHRRMMRLYCRAGDRPGAMRQYERCSAALREDLGLEPAEQTSALLEQIRHDALDGRPALGPRSAEHYDLAELRSMLASLQSTLEATQLQVRKQLDVVEHLLRGRRM